MHSRTPSTTRWMMIASLSAVVMTAGLAQSVALGQPGRTPPRQQVRHPDPIPQRETLIRLSRPITVDFADQRLEDVMSFLREYTNADIEVMWMTDRHHVGLDPDHQVTLNVQNMTVLRLIERILDHARDDFTENTWQMSETGSIQIGPKSRLNRYTRRVIYDINDLLMEIPDYPDVPRIDLNQALQAAGGGGGGGGGGQSPFQDDQDDRERERKEREERAQEIVDLITEVVEMEQWVQNGGDAGRIRVFRGSLIVTAPDYMHRGIMGYPYWPAGATVSRQANGQRYVTLTTDNSISALAGLPVQPVTATAPGTGGGGSPPSGPPGGGG